MLPLVFKLLIKTLARISAAFCVLRLRFSVETIRDGLEFFVLGGKRTRGGTRSPT